MQFPTNLTVWVVRVAIRKERSWLDCSYKLYSWLRAFPSCLKLKCKKITYFSHSLHQWNREHTRSRTHWPYQYRFHRSCKDEVCSHQYLGNFKREFENFRKTFSIYRRLRNSCFFVSIKWTYIVEVDHKRNISFCESYLISLLWNCFSVVNIQNTHFIIITYREIPAMFSKAFSPT